MGAFRPRQERAALAGPAPDQAQRPGPGCDRPGLGAIATTVQLVKGFDPDAYSRFHAMGLADNTALQASGSRFRS